MTITILTAVNNPAPPSLPVGVDEYERRFQDQYSNVLRLYFNQLSKTLGVIITNQNTLLQLPHGAFYDATSTQTAAVINTAYPVRFDTTTDSEGVSVTGTPKTKFVTDIEGHYNFQFSLQVAKTSGGAAYAYVWARVDGVDIPDSATKLVVQGTSAEVVAAWNFVLPMQQGSYFELMWAVSDTHVQLSLEAATAFCPAIPSAIMTVTFVSGLH